MSDNEICNDELENEYRQAEKTRETHPYFLHDTEEREAYMSHYRETHDSMSKEDIRKARLTYKRLELLSMETQKDMDCDFLYKIGFIEIKYKHWRQGRYLPTKQELKAIADFYSVTPDYFEKGILPHISVSKFFVVF